MGGLWVTGSPLQAVPKEGSCRHRSGSVWGCWMLLFQRQQLSTVGLVEHLWGWGTHCGSLLWPWVPSMGHRGPCSSVAVPPMLWAVLGAAGSSSSSLRLFEEAISGRQETHTIHY